MSKLEVIYIGKGTADCALDRLDGHSTLEKVLADVLRKEPNKEVALLLMKFKMQKDVIRPETTIAGQAEIRRPKADKHFKKIMEYQPDIKEQTKIVEAMLIDYFKTSVYNMRYVNGLSDELAVFRNVYKLDFDALIAEVDTENIGGISLCSQNVSPAYHYDAILDIRKQEGRFSVLEPRS